MVRTKWIYPLEFETQLKEFFDNFPNARFSFHYGTWLVLDAGEWILYTNDGKTVVSRGESLTETIEAGREHGCLHD